MPNIQLSLNDSEHTILTAAAAKQGIPVVDYIRSRIFDEENEFTTAYAETLRRVEAFYDMVSGGAVTTAEARGKDSSNIMQYVRI